MLIQAYIAIIIQCGEIGHIESKRSYDHVTSGLCASHPPIGEKIGRDALNLVYASVSYRYGVNYKLSASAWGTVAQCMSADRDSALACGYYYLIGNQSPDAVHKYIFCIDNACIGRDGIWKEKQ